MKRLLSIVAALARWWRDGYVSVRVASVYVLLLAALFFLIGSHRPAADYRALEKEVADARQEMRLFADEMARRNGLLGSMHARDRLNQQTIELLGEQIGALESAGIHWQEENAFYRQALESAPPGSGGILIHALEATQDFTRESWEISAILVRPGKNRNFSGSYYFEIVESDADGNHTLTRLPDAGREEFTMNFYHEIAQLLPYSPDRDIQNLRVLVFDKKGKEVAAVEMSGDNPDLPADES